MFCLLSFLIPDPLKDLFVYFHRGRITWKRAYRDIPAKVCVVWQSQSGEDLKILVILMGKDCIWGLRAILRGGLKMPGA